MKESKRKRESLPTSLVVQESHGQLYDSFLVSKTSSSVGKTRIM